MCLRGDLFHAPRPPKRSVGGKAQKKQPLVLLSVLSVPTQPMAGRDADRKRRHLSGKSSPWYCGQLHKLARIYFVFIRRLKMFKLFKYALLLAAAIYLLAVLIPRTYDVPGMKPRMDTQ